MIRAIYRAREDGDYDFIAAFAEEHDYDEHPAVELRPHEQFEFKLED